MVVCRGCMAAGQAARSKEWVIAGPAAWAEDGSPREHDGWMENASYARGAVWRTGPRHGAA